MCGIAGLVGPPGAPIERAAIAAAMAATLAHRGPDDSGSWADPTGQAALGFQRLSILDLSPEGHQPMASADGRYTVVLNGEIYNFADLKEELLAVGCTFRGRSDTEVLLAAVSQWGIEVALPRLWGMFAIGLWDQQDRVLHLIRDRLGKKPLYYGWQGDTLLFGSELKALRAHRAFRATIDRDALASFLRFSYVPAPRSIYAGIHKLPSGSWTTIHPERPREDITPRRWWDPVAGALAGQADPLDLSDEEATCEVEQLLADAVRRRAIADVPLGAFLSGGIDSSTIVALLQAQSRLRVSTFTIGFDEARYDESAHARAVASHLGTDHTELRVTPEQAQAVIPRLGRLYDEPFADASQIPTFLVSELARRSVTVALSGDGGDEVFGGYNRYVAGTRLWSHLGRVPRPIRRGISNLATAIRPDIWDGAGTLVDRVLPSSKRGVISGNRVHKLATAIDLGGVHEMYARLVSTWPHPNGMVVGGTELDLSWLAAGDGLVQPADRMMLLDLLAYLPEDILTKVDRASMGTSLEARAPFLDHRVVELSWRIPIHQKIRGGESKFLIRRILERHVPRSIFERPKSGFGIPIDAWLRGPLREWAQDLLSPQRLVSEGFLEPAPIEAALRDHLDGRRNRQYQLWAVLMFQSWLEETARAGSPA
jgi:asparagine synthase (glutamine-hydrolysing)